MHILPVLAGLEVLVLGGGPDIFFFVHLNCASNSASLCLYLLPAIWSGQMTMTPMPPSVRANLKLLYARGCGLSSPP